MTKEYEKPMWRSARFWDRTEIVLQAWFGIQVLMHTAPYAWGWMFHG